MTMRFEGKKTPVFLIAYNRLHYLRQLVDWLDEAGYTNIHIIDNASSYPPLLDYYEDVPHTVHRMERNYGHLVLWDSHRFDETILQRPFILSDCDVLPVEGCPSDVAEYLFGILRRYRNFTKVGLSLKIDDIPDHYALKANVLEWEAPFWQHPLEGGSLYEAAIDTTFALYRPGIPPQDQRWWRSLRTTSPYMARHLPWYADTSVPTEEDVFYQRNVTELSSQWSVTDPVMLKEQNIKLQLEVLNLRMELDALRRGRPGFAPSSGRRDTVRQWLKAVGLLAVAQRLRRWLAP